MLNRMAGFETSTTLEHATSPFERMYFFDLNGCVK